MRTREQLGRLRTDNRAHSIQKGLRADGNEWISLHRGFDRAELATATRDVNGTNELLMRNQFRAWVRFMTLDMADS